MIDDAEMRAIRVVVLIAVAGLTRPAAGGPCSHSCEEAQMDEHGCCPSKPSPVRVTTPKTKPQDRPRPATPAGTRAWVIAQSSLSVETALVIGVDLAALTKTQLFIHVLPIILQKVDAQTLLSNITNTCTFDPLSVAKSAVIALDADATKGALYLGVKGIDSTSLSLCIKLVAKNQNKEVTVRRDGSITELAWDQTKVNFGWIGDDVIVVALGSIDDKAELRKWMTGSGLRSSKLGSVAKADTTANIWGASRGHVFDPTMVNGYGSIKWSGGSINVDARADMTSAKDATVIATRIKTEIKTELNAPDVPSSVTKVVSRIAISATKAELSIKGSIAEREVVDVIDALSQP